MALHVLVVVIGRSVPPAGPAIHAIPRLQVLLELAGTALALRIDVAVEGVDDGVGERRVDVVGTLEFGVHEDLRGVKVVAGFYEEAGGPRCEVVIEVRVEEPTEGFDVIEEGGDRVRRVRGAIV